MPPIVSPPPPPVPIEVISPRETEELLATDGATLSSSTPPSADPAVAQASAKDLYLNPNSGLSLGGAPVAPNSKIGDRPVQVPIPTAKKIISQSRDGEIQEYLITVPSESELEVITGPTREAEPTVEEKGQEAIGEVLEIDPGASQTETENNPEPSQFLDSSPIPATEADEVAIPPEVIELISDHQEFDSNREVVTATGNVTMRFANGLLLADRLRVNLPDRFAVAEGNVTLKRGEQILQGQRFEYFFVLNQGVIYDANGEIYQPSTARDFAQTVPTDFGNPIVSNQSLNDRLAINQPVTNVVGQEGFRAGIGASTPGAQSASQTDSGGQVNRLRFQAEQVDFDADGWRAKKVRITNDPFNPPELEVQAETADYYNVGPDVDELKLTGSRVLLDQKTSLPFQDRLTIDRRDRQPGLISIGYDGEDRGGLYVQGNFTPIDTDKVSFQVKPQYLLQKVAFPDAFPAANQSDAEVCAICPAAFGLITELNVDFTERINLLNTLNFSNLNLDAIEDSLRAKLALQNRLGDLDNPYDLRFEYNYRERLFNGSLGFQTVQSSVGAIIVSPTIYPLDDDPSLSFNYQASLQSVEAATDRQELINPSTGDNLVTLMRLQGAATLNKYFLLWVGEALPPTAEEGLRYTPNVVVPYVVFNTGVTGVGSYYGDGSTQPSLTGTVGFSGQFGNFSKPYFDYTGFNIAYSQGIRGDASPFFFDRFADTQVVSFGLTQQIYGPVRLGVQGAYSLTANEEISTDYVLEYSRRTYNIQLRYNPQLQVGSINLRISDFNWSGNPGTFDGSDIRPVTQGVVR
ncbi:DUF3769 domain-containing protein [Synechocystis sp. PCC 7338]|uniref:DUF3769 domain-containing protein n=1 Tax=Synechocystis sp. PCC 7338 TaxID=2732530 RepID=UPI001BB0B863|nr:DUF3769 domain-containing protein [Synechocystis sp. PCC 7338]QUS61122.1 DUF3769 domain-containing protein [Synechocystis sp. PCC 7338]